MSGYDTWNQKEHGCEYLIFPENIDPHLSIDALSLSKSELNTFVTNMDPKVKMGTLVAVIIDSKADNIEAVLVKISIEKRNLVTEIILDMAKNMEAGVKNAFPNATLVTDYASPTDFMR